VQVKAAGGVRDLDGLILVRDLGATRCGASATAAILDEYRKRAASKNPPSGSAQSKPSLGGGGY
jgi:deoxyribose-phosphate aldolase